jgi:hypothetical protein
MNLDEIALEVDKISAEVGEDPFEMFRAATSGERIVILIGHDDAVDRIEGLIKDLTPAEIAQIDRTVFNNATGQV